MLSAAVTSYLFYTVCHHFGRLVRYLLLGKFTQGATLRNTMMLHDTFNFFQFEPQKACFHPPVLSKECKISDKEGWTAP